MPSLLSCKDCLRYFLDRREYTIVVEKMGPKVLIKKGMAKLLQQY